MGKPSLLIMMMVMLVSLFAVGCGDSNNDFVFTGNNNNNPNNNPGTLTFQFVKANAQATVPATTVSIRFDYLDAEGDEIGAPDIEPFAESITVTPPAGMVSVRITPIDGNGFPVAQATATQAFPPNNTDVDVDMSAYNFTAVTLTSIVATPDPTNVTVGGSQQLTVTGTFSNGDVVTFGSSAIANTDFTPDNSGTFSVNATGSVTGVAAGPGLLTVAYGSVTDTVTVNVSTSGDGVFTVTPDPLTVGVGTTSDPVVVSFTPAGDTTLTVPNSEVTFTIVGAGFTANDDGTVTVAPSVAPNTSATLTATWTDEDDNVRTDSITVTAVNSSVFSQPSTDTLLLPYDGFEFQTAVSFNGQHVDNFFANGYTFSSSDTDVATISSGGVLETGEEGTSTISLLLNGTVVDSFVLTTDDIDITSIVVDPDEFNLSPGKIVPYSVIATYSNNLTADIAGSLDLNIFYEEGDGANDATFYAGRAIGGQDYGDAVYTFQYGAAEDNVTVNQAAGFITDYEVYVGGLTSGLIPERFTAVVDVFATLDTGETVRLRPDQFDLEELEDEFDAFFLDGNEIGDDGHDVGDTGLFEVSLLDSDFQPATMSVNGTREFSVQVVDNQDSVCSVEFTNYSDSPVMFDRYSRPITYLFSNGAVQNFKVADEDASLRGQDVTGGLTTDSDIWGYPCLVDNNFRNGGFSDYYKGPLTIQINDAGDVFGTATMPVEVWAAQEAVFNPAVIIMQPGETREVEVIITGSPEPDGPPEMVWQPSALAADEEQFSRALDFAYRSFDNSDSVFARRGNECRVTALFPDDDAQVEARDIVSGDWVADLIVVIQGDQPE